MARSDRALLAFLIGAAAGLSVGFLFAPAKGKKTRKRLSDKASELKDKLKESIDTDRLRELANSAKSGVEKYGQKFTKAAKE